jgi:hypothetical protein
MNLKIQQSVVGLPRSPSCHAVPLCRIGTTSRLVTIPWTAMHLCQRWHLPAIRSYVALHSGRLQFRSERAPGGQFTLRPLCRPELLSVCRVGRARRSMMTFDVCCCRRCVRVQSEFMSLKCEPRGPSCHLLRLLQKIEPIVSAIPIQQFYDFSF